MARLKESKASGGGEGAREQVAETIRERDEALQEVAELKKLLAEQNRQLATAAKQR